MKPTSILITIISILFILAGCANTRRIIENKSIENKTGVFNELKEDGASLHGKSVLSLNLSFKTHADDFYKYEPKKSHHGKPSYRILLNIDGQPVIWEAKGFREITPILDENDKRITDPEAGNGVRYTLNKKLLIAPGKHVVFFSLPDENYYREFGINVLEGNENYFKLKPLYYLFGKRRKVQSFLGGIKKFNGIYNSVSCIDK